MSANVSAPQHETRLRVARALREIAVLLRVSGESRFKVRAYERAAHAIEHTTRDLGDLIDRHELALIPGIGARLASTIEEVCRTGRSQLLTRLRARFPPGTAELIDVPYLGVKKIGTLHRVLGISSRDELKAACEAGRLREAPGFGASMERKILAALTSDNGAAPQYLLVTALGAAELLLRWLRTGPPVHRAEIVGAVRRSEEVVEAVELVAATSDINALLDHFLRYPNSVGTVSRGTHDATLRLLAGPPATLHAMPTGSYVNALHYFTGAPAHIDKLCARARADGIVVTPMALTTDRGERVLLRNEQDLYRRLGLQLVEPELREDTGEIEAAAKGTLPTDLVRLEDMQGITHVHTVYSDGRDTIEEMARAAASMGMRYLTITDHSPSAGYAGGVTLDRLQRQWEEIARVQERVGIRLLRGTESDILRDGSLDYDDTLLQQFDVVIASIHARYHMSPEEMTARVVRAVRHPMFKIWGHPLGRLLRSRPPFDCDVEAILDAIAETRTAIEINGDPHRLDLPPRWIRAAHQRGIPFVLSTDAHSVAGLLNLRFAVSMARRGWVSRSEVLNTLPAEEFLAAVRPA